MSQGRALDCHVHIIGDGSSGSGCFLMPRGYSRFLAQIIVRHLGMPPSTLRTGLDAAYESRLVEMVRESSLDAAVILAHEYTRDSQGNIIEGFNTFYTPNDYVLNLAKRHPEFLPAVSIHPARPDALDELDRCIEGGAVMMKCLPNVHNIDCSNRRFKRFWERMAEAGIVLLAHTGGELSLPVYNHAFANPEVLLFPLECGVTVITAHSGTNSLLFDPNYVETFLEMIKQYPNLYGDNSALLTPFRSKDLKRLAETNIQERIVHGSDLPIPVSGLWTGLRGALSWKDYRQWNSISNVLERDLKLKQAIGFGDEVFQRLSRLLKLSVDIPAR